MPVSVYACMCMRAHECACVRACMCVDSYLCVRAWVFVWHERKRETEKEKMCVHARVCVCTKLIITKKDTAQKKALA